LGRNEEATEAAIEDIVSALKGKTDPYVILSRFELTYVQALWTDQGFLLEYQDRNVMKHFESRILLSRPQVVAAMQSYLAEDENWQRDIEFEKKDIADTWTKMGFSAGSFLGNLIRRFRDARMKKQNSNKSLDRTS
jgi:hypothetical protein